MKCDRFNKRIYLFLDKRLKPGEEDELKAHLSECKRCQKKLSDLELAEKLTKGIKIKEPPSEYWDSFSYRVREKNLAQEERTPILGLKKALVSIFTFSPWKIRIAAGFVSVVLVFIIGKLYIDYRGKEVVPSTVLIQKAEKPRPYIPEIENKEGFLPDKGKKKTITKLDKLETGKGTTTVDQSTGKGIPKGKVISEKEFLSKEDQAFPSAKTKEEKEISSKKVGQVEPTPPPALEIQAPMEAEERDRIASPLPEAKPTGAGIEKGVEKTQEAGIAVQKEESNREEKAPQKGEARKPINMPEFQLKAKDITAPVRTEYNTSATTDQYYVDEKTVPRIKETDTLMQADELRKIIRTWRVHIKENPTDSLSQQGYLQVAIGCYLLCKLSQDTTDISQGSQLIEEYYNQTQDSKIKEQLSDKLNKIKALGRR